MEIIQHLVVDGRVWLSVNRSVNQPASPWPGKCLRWYYVLTLQWPSYTPSLCSQLHFIPKERKLITGLLGIYIYIYYRSVIYERWAACIAARFSSVSHASDECFVIIQAPNANWYGKNAPALPHGKSPFVICPDKSGVWESSCKRFANRACVVGCPAKKLPHQCGIFSPIPQFFWFVSPDRRSNLAALITARLWSSVMLNTESTHWRCGLSGKSVVLSRRG
jgi:hypothetical protein